ncbi:MAG: restriction endonuclease [Clostridia bacterium]|nr:restriction endonuclease [Clostridia bacterium]
MLNYNNLSDVEFENLCQDVMSSKLGEKLHKFAPGSDGGIDLRNDRRNIVVQVKHYMNSTTSQLLDSLKKEVSKIDRLNPKEYYVCCSKQLSPNKIDEIYNLFSKYMSSISNIITLNEIDDFLIDEKNIEILKKHYKLWIGSTNIIEDIFTKDIGLDSEILFSEIEAEMNLFVRTKAYDVAVDCLEKTRTLLIIGEPGVGKTITSKMLILYYLSKDYKLRYTTDCTNLSDLKKALSQNPDVKEIIFLDDCFGQAYFRMKETQGNELLYIIKHVNLHSNKILILNSRVTIYSEAKTKTPALVKSFDNKEYKLFVLDMSNINDIDKAEILYNHLYFEKIEPEYFDAIKYNKRYNEIIKHPNYNPRIIEFISKKSIYKKILPKDYFQFIISNLKNPKLIWQDEYENRLDAVDRLLLTTIYSLTDTNVSINLVKKCFEYRLREINNIDFSLNHFEMSLKRLEKAFVKIVDSYGRQMIAMVNPSVNDFLDSYLNENVLERVNLIKNACSVRQLKKLLSQEQYTNKLLQLFESHNILSYYFENENQRIGFIACVVAVHNIRDKVYLPMIQLYMKDYHDVDVYEKIRVRAIDIIKKLLSKDAMEFYEIDRILKDEVFLHKFLEDFQLDELVDILLLIDDLFIGAERKLFIDLAKEEIKEVIELYCSDVPAENYQIDLHEITNDGDEFDRYNMENVIEQEISELVTNEVKEYLDLLPAEFKIDENIMDNIFVTLNGVGSIIDKYFSDVDYEPEMFYERNFEDNEIDLMFNRKIIE